MSSGADHYTDAEVLLNRAINERGIPEPLRAELYSQAHIHATLALAAATALVTTCRMVGDSQDVTDWARSVQPGALKDGQRQPTRSSMYPEQWPPTPGSLWDDRNGDRWICPAYNASVGYLMCLSRTGDDNAGEVWRVHGPLVYAGRITTSADEPPF